MIEGTAAKLARLREDTEGENTGSNDSSSSNLFSNSDDTSKIGDEEEGVEVENDEKVNQVEDPTPNPIIAPLAQIPITEPILVLSSASNVADDISFSRVLPT